MDSRPDNSKVNRTRLQFGLPLLFSIVTLLCFAFAYPFLFASAPALLILLGTPFLLIFGIVRAVQKPGRVRLFWTGFLLVGSPLFFAAWLPAPEGYNLINYLMFLSIDTLADVIPDRPGVKPPTPLDVAIGAVVSTFWISVPLILGVASGKMAVALFAPSLTDAPGPDL